MISDLNLIPVNHKWKTEAFTSAWDVKSYKEC